MKLMILYTTYQSFVNIPSTVLIYPLSSSGLPSSSNFTKVFLRLSTKPFITNGLSPTWPSFQVCSHLSSCQPPFGGAICLGSPLFLGDVLKPVPHCVVSRISNSVRSRLVITVLSLRSVPHRTEESGLGLDSTTPDWMSYRCLHSVVYFLIFLYFLIYTPPTFFYTYSLVKFNI